MATGTQIEKGQERATIMEQLDVEVGASAADVLKLIPNADGDVWYVAYRNGDAVGACIALTHWEDGGWYFVKIVEEEAGPFGFAAPPEVLDILTPTTNEYANEWREACRVAATGVIH